MHNKQQSINLKEIVKDLLNGYSSIFFSQNKLFGIILLIISFLSIRAGLYGLLDAILVNFLAKALHLSELNIKTGYYSFNAILTGIAIGTLFPFGKFSLFMLFASAIFIILLCVVLEGILKRHYLPYLSIPFLITLWIIMLSTQQTDDLTGFSSLSTPTDLIQTNITDSINQICTHCLPDVIQKFILSLGYVFFQPNLIAGIIIAIGILLYSRIAFLFSIINYAVAYLLYFIIDGSIYNLSFQYYGFNFIFTSIAIGCYYVIPSVKSLMWSLLLIPVQFLCIFASSRMLNYLFLPTYSFSFCITTLLYLFFLRQHSNSINPEIANYLENNPEKSLYHTIVNTKRFAFLNYVPIGLPFLGQWKISQGYNGLYTHQNKWKEALDFVIEDNQNKQYQGNGISITDYYCYGKPVIAPANGTIINYENNIEDNEVGERNLEHNWGNYILIKHGENVYTAICHLKKGSITTKVGNRVIKGEKIGLCGNSGNSPYPHIHMQVQTQAMIGAHTISYPIGNYLVQKGDSYEYKQSYIPKEKEIISNVNPSEQIQEAYNLFNYKEFIVKNGNKEEKWYQKTDIYGLSYLEDKNNNMAWFENNGIVFYFIRYEGNKKSNLYHFFQANYKVLLCTDKPWTITDNYSLQYAKMGIKKIWSDCITFIKKIYQLEYQIQYTPKECQKAGIFEMNAEIRSLFYKQKKIENSFKITILDKNIYQIETTGSKTDTELMIIEGKRY